MAATENRKGAGRPVGAIGRKSLEAIGILNEMGCEPLEILGKIAMGKPFPNGELPTNDQLKSAAEQLLQYKYPKLKAVEHSGSIATHEESLEALEELDDAEGDGA